MPLVAIAYFPSAVLSTGISADTCPTTSISDEGDAYDKLNETL